jgi:hypothetical protein
MDTRSSIVLSLLVAAGSIAAAAEPKLPAPVSAWLKGAADLCREVEGKPSLTDAVKRADLNGDGVEDYVVTVEGIRCEGAASIYGDREKAMAVFVGDDKGGATQAFSDSAFGLEVKPDGARSKLWLTVMGQQCGRKPAKDFASEAFCERPLLWDPARRMFDCAPVSQVRMLQ